MPNLATHIHFAMKSLPKSIDQDLTPIYLLGATTPDIRVITKENRSIYHFVDLDFKSVGEGIANMTQQFPEIHMLKNNDEIIKTFLTGYITHLVLDETWITTVFRKHFSGPNAFPESTPILIIDRAIQMYMDNKYWNSIESKISPIEQCNIEKVSLPFLSNDSINEWREWICNFLNLGFSWDRLNFMAKRISNGNIEDPAIPYTEQFLIDPIKNINNVFNFLPKNLLEEFEENSKQNIDNAISGFLNEYH